MVGLAGRATDGWPLPTLERRLWQDEHSGMWPTRTVAVTVQPGRRTGSVAC